MRRWAILSRAFLGGAGALGLALAATGPARAVLLLYEPFAYDEGTVLDGTPATGTNLTGTYTPLGANPFQKLEVAAPGLGYGNLLGAPTPLGLRTNDTNGVTAAGASASLAQEIAIAPGEAVFWSALFTFDDSNNGNRLANITLRDDASGDAIGFGEDAIGSRAVRISASTTATGGLLADGESGSFADGDTLLLIGRYLNGAAADGDLLQLLGYDTADADVLPASFDFADPAAEFAYELRDLDIDLARISSVTFTIRGTDDNAIDELRVARTYAALLPEPGPVLLLLVAAGASGLRGRRSGR